MSIEVSCRLKTQSPRSGLRDLGGWRRERMPKEPDAPSVTLAPDWVCEVLSPSIAGVGCKNSIERKSGRTGVVQVGLPQPPWNLPPLPGCRSSPQA